MSQEARSKEPFITKSERPELGPDFKASVFPHLGASLEEFKELIWELLKEGTDESHVGNIEAAKDLVTPSTIHVRGGRDQDYNDQMEDKQNQIPDEDQGAKKLEAHNKNQPQESIADSKDTETRFTLPRVFDRARTPTFSHESTGKRGNIENAQRFRTTLDIIPHTPSGKEEILILHSSHESLSGLAHALAAAGLKAGYQARAISYSCFMKHYHFTLSLRKEACTLKEALTRDLSTGSQLLGVVLLGRFDWSPYDLDEQDTEYAFSESLAAMEAVWHWANLPVLGRPGPWAEANGTGGLAHLVSLSSQFGTRTCPIASLQTQDQATELGFINVRDSSCLSASADDLARDRQDYRMLAETGRSGLPLLLRKGHFPCKLVLFQIGLRWLGARPSRGTDGGICFRSATIPRKISDICDIWASQCPDGLAQFEFFLDTRRRIELLRLESAPSHFSLCSYRLRNLIVDSVLTELVRSRDDPVMRSAI